MPINRRLVVRDKDGNLIRIDNNKQLKDFLATLTPEELEQYKLEYRFAPISNDTNSIWYAGSIGDLGAIIG